jgi:hypothetical protein
MVTDDKAVAINSLIDAVKAIEKTLGITPFGVYSDVRVRLDILEARINDPYSPSPTVTNPFYIDGYGVSISSGDGYPTEIRNNGSLYLRTDGYIYEGLYAYRNGHWVLIPTDFWTASQDLSGGYYSQTVIGIQNRSVSDVMPLDGYNLTWNDLDAKWEPQIGFEANKDLSGTKIEQTVIGIQGNPISSSIPVDGYVLTWNSGIWQPSVLPTTAVIFDPLPTSTNIVANRPINQSTIDNSKIGIVNLGNNDLLDPVGVKSNYSVLLGGLNNVIDNDYGSIVGGYNNSILNGSCSSIINGLNGKISGGNSAIIDGYDGYIDGYYSVIIDGSLNEIIGNYSSILNGYENNINDNFCSILGGYNNLANGTYSSIINGLNGEVHNNFSTIINGSDGYVDGLYGTVINGNNNSATGDYVIIANGNNNIAIQQYATIINGINNSINGLNSTIINGNDNIIVGNDNIINGSNNNINSNNVTIFGSGQTVNSSNSVLLGQNNLTNSNYTFIFGNYNIIDSNADYSKIDGYYNYADAAFSSVSGKGAKSRIIGQVAHAVNNLTNVGDSQYSKIILEGAEVSGGRFYLNIPGTSNNLSLEDNKSYDMRIRILVVNTGGAPTCARYVYEVLAHQQSGVLILDEVNEDLIDENSTGWTTSITTLGSELIIQVDASGVDDRRAIATIECLELTRG